MAITGGYTLNHGRAYAGEVADGELNNTISRLNGTTAAIEHGIFVAADGFNKFKPVATGAEVIGVTRRELDRVTETNGVFAIQPNTDGGILTVGTIWVKATEALARGDDVEVILTGDDAGKVKKAATADDAFEGITVVDYDADAQLAKISLKIGG